MKKIFIFLAFIIVGISAIGQTPQFFNYQAVLRNSTGGIIASQTVNLRVSIHDLTPSGTVVFQETHSGVTTTSFGVINISIGSGTSGIGTIGGVAWATGNKYVEVELDYPTGSGYVSTGTQQLLSVPYALYAANANVPGVAGPTGPTGANGVIGPTGTTGAQGIQGVTGVAGPTGPSGSLNAWSLTGNAGMVDGTNFIGTTDNIPFSIRVNNQPSARITNSTISLFGYQTGSGNVSANITAFGNQALSTSNSGEYNTAMGYQALKVNTTGTNNTATGYRALFFNTTGFYNTADGYAAVWSNTSGSRNTGTGWAALYSNTTGNQNTAVGVEALFLQSYSNSDTPWASNNVAVGYRALYNNQPTATTNGIQNNAFGNNALYSNTTGRHNTVMGDSAGYKNSTGSENIAFGYGALFNNNIGNTNIAIGKHAMYLSTSSSNNVAIGDSAIFTNGASINTAVGSKSMTKNSGTANTASGFQSMYNSTIGSHNCAYGVQSLFVNTGSYNCGLGALSLTDNTNGSFNTGVGRRAIQNNTTGSDNVGVGYMSLNNNLTGTFNTCIGDNADVSVDALTNATAIGSISFVNASNKVRIGSTAVTVIEGQVAYTFPSDGRFKFNVKEEVKGLEFIMKLRPVTYNFDTKKFNDFLTKNQSGKDADGHKPTQDFTESSSIIHTGFIAQEVEQAAKESGFTFDGVSAPKDENGNFGVAYSQFTVPLVKAIQEQQKMIEELQKQNAQMKKEIEELKKK